MRVTYPAGRAAHVTEPVGLGTRGVRRWAAVTDVASPGAGAICLRTHQEDVMNHPLITAELARLHRCDLLRQARVYRRSRLRRLLGGAA